MIEKVFLYNPEFSSNMMRGREEKIVDGIATYLPTLVPKNIYWKCMDVVEAAGMSEEEFCFRVLVTLADLLNMNEESAGKDTPDCSMALSKSRDKEFLHIYMYNVERDKAFKETYAGRQIPTDKMEPTGENVTTITNLGYMYEGKEDSGVYSVFDHRAVSIIKPATINEPEACRLCVERDRLVFEFTQGSDIYEIMETANEDMAEKVHSIPKRQDVMEQRQTLMDNLEVERNVEKPEQRKRLMTPDDFFERRGAWGIE